MTVNAGKFRRALKRIRDVLDCIQDRENRHIPYKSSPFEMMCCSADDFAFDWKDKSEEETEPETNPLRLTTTLAPTPQLATTFPAYWSVHFARGCADCHINYADLLPEKKFREYTKFSPSLQLLAIFLFLRREYPLKDDITLPFIMDCNLDLNYEDIYRSFRFVCQRCKHTSALLSQDVSKWIPENFHRYHLLYTEAAKNIQQEQRMLLQKKFFIVQNISKDDFRPGWSTHYVDFFRDKPKPPKSAFEYEELYAFVYSANVKQSPEMIEEYFRAWKEQHTHLIIRIIFITNCDEFINKRMGNHLIYLYFNIFHLSQKTKNKTCKINDLINNNCRDIVLRFESS